VEMLDEMARRYATTPDALVSDPDTHPVEAAWFRLMLCRTCAIAGWAIAKQRAREIGAHGGGVQYVVTLPGS